MSKQINEALTLKLDPVQAYVVGNLLKWAVQQPQVRSASMGADAMSNWVQKGGDISQRILTATDKSKGFTVEGPDTATVMGILDWARKQGEVAHQSGPDSMVDIASIIDDVYQSTKKVKQEKPVVTPEVERGYKDEPAPTPPREEAPAPRPSMDRRQPGMGSGQRRDYDPDQIVGEAKVNEEDTENCLKAAYKDYVKDVVKNEEEDILNLMSFDDWVAQQSQEAKGNEGEEEKEEKEEPAEEPAEEDGIKTIISTGESVVVRNDKATVVRVESPEEAEEWLESVNVGGREINVFDTLRKKEYKNIYVIVTEDKSEAYLVLVPPTGKAETTDWVTGEKVNLDDIKAKYNLGESKKKIDESTIAEWEGDIEKLSDEEKAKFLQALDTLEGWQLFKSEFEWTQIFTLKTLLGGIGQQSQPTAPAEPAPTVAPPMEGKVPDVGKDTEGEMVKKLMEKHGLTEGKVPDVGKDTEAEMQKKLQEQDEEITDEPVVEDPTQQDDEPIIDEPAPEEDAPAAEVNVDFGNKEVNVIADDGGVNVSTADKPGEEPLPEPVVTVNPEEEPAFDEPVVGEEEDDIFKAPAEDEAPFEGKVPDVGKDTEGEMQKKLQEEIGNSVTDNLTKWLK